MFKKALFAGLVSVSMFAVGCGGNACEDAADRIKAKMEECKLEVPEASGDSEGGECNEAAAAQAEKFADEYEKLSCDTINPAG